MHADDLFTAPQVAKICFTDLKTIHNWVNRGDIRSFRTPGRHLRFRRQDIIEFLVRFGYPVPEGFSPGRGRVVVIDRRETNLRSLKRALGKDLEVETFGEALDAMLAIGRERPGLVVVAVDGAEDLHFVERLTQIPDAVPVLAYGSSANLEDKAMRAGASDFVTSTDSKEIRRRVVSLLGL